MKNFFYVVLSSMIFISCVNNTKTTDNGYCKKFDTIYKDNSTNIESVTRTFYFIGDEANDFLKVSKEIGKNDYSLTIHDDKNFGTIILNSKGFNSFIANSKTIVDNKGKDLKYDIGDLKNSSMTASVMVKNGINIYTENVLGESVSYELSNEDITNLEKAFNKFNSEK